MQLCGGDIDDACTDSGIIINIHDQHRPCYSERSHVILSGAKNLCAAREILRFTQNDMRGEGDTSLHSE